MTNGVFIVKTFRDLKVSSEERPSLLQALLLAESLAGIGPELNWYFRNGEITASAGGALFTIERKS